jgi:hypothetical protein
VDRDCSCAAVALPSTGTLTLGTGSLINGKNYF